ncbi:carboxymethylenebutenolidase [Teladorsagia circumcincta]|uniref:Carboxymethylenebutenolidase n=1 Tax=Teladorsagia circumcincta TaxID=45464 RepID=A0A2G9UP49_TELCI|nr:carboxymethylenebutenolidase [Teladorsagia circumcincta]
MQDPAGKEGNSGDDDVAKHNRRHRCWSGPRKDVVPMISEGVKIGCIGFCFGGLTCLDLARFDVGLEAAVSFHGTLTNYPGNNTYDLPMKYPYRSIGASIQAHHGDIDPHTTNADAESFKEEMRARDADWFFTSYSDAMHAFTLPGVENWGIPGAAYNEKADKRSWRAMQTFLAEKLL